MKANNSGTSGSDATERDSGKHPASLKAQDLASLRRQIDEVDGRILAALRERADIVSHISSAKAPGSSFLRPGREAEILRRIAGQAKGPLGEAVIARIWRELISGLYHLQVNLSVAVAAPRQSVAYWDIARNHFGSSVPMSLHRTVPPVIRLVTEDPGCIGILPLPEFEAKDPWWLSLISETPETPRIVGRLPFASSPAGRFENVEALLLARAAPEPSGDDHSLIVLVQQNEGMSMTRTRDLLPKVGLQGQVISLSRTGIGPVALIEARGFIKEDDRLLEQLLTLSDGMAVRALVIGAYPVPMAHRTV